MLGSPSLFSSSFLPSPLSSIAVVVPLLSAKASLAKEEKESGERGKERRGKMERADYITAAAAVLAS